MGLFLDKENIPFPRDKRDVFYNPIICTEKIYTPNQIFGKQFV